MDVKIFDSIVEITNKRDSDEFSLSIVATIAQLLESSTVALFHAVENPFLRYQPLVTLTTQKDHSGIKQYLWDVELPDATLHYIEQHFSQLSKMTVYQTDDGMFHTFLPIPIDGNIAYGLDIASNKRFSDQLNEIIAITRVCQNFYAILSSSEKDSLTGLLNRKTYDQKLSGLLRKQYINQQKNIKPLGEERDIGDQAYTWLAIIDIDHFKRVNDRYGHIYGDEVLLVLSQLMKRAFRQNDLLFRFGGEEFVVIVEPIKQAQVVNVLEKFRQLVESHNFPMVGSVTISIGYAKVKESDHPKTIFDNADKALYHSKNNGRNCLNSYEDLLSKNLVESDFEEGDIELF